jgi:hypothetical protein
MGEDIRPGTHPHAALDLDEDSRAHQFVENTLRGRLRNCEQALEAQQIKPGRGILDDVINDTPADFAANLTISTLGRHAVTSLQHS